MRYPLRSFLALTLLSIPALVADRAAAAPVPPKGRRPAAVESVDQIRVMLGNFARASISGIDLTIDGRQTLEGNVTFSLRCGSTARGPFIDYGASRVAAGRLEVSAPGGFLRVDGKLYRNRLTVLARGQNCAVINTVDIEKYLAGLINKEMVPSWPVEALKAQSVAARTYAVYQALQNRGKDADLDSSVLDQVYDGAASETPRSTAVVEATRGQILSFGRQPVKAYFHANCGGMTETPVAVWGTEDEAFRPVVCPYHQRKRDRQRWSLHVSRLQLERALRKVSGLIPRGFARLASLEAGAPTPSQRLNDVVVADATGNNLVLSANGFRNALGNTKVKSTAFQIHQEGDGFRLDGEGFGHGVGLCQVGARAMAEEGKRYREILAYYYPLAELRRF